MITHLRSVQRRNPKPYNDNFSRRSPDTEGPPFDLAFNHVYPCRPALAHGMKDNNH